MLRSGCLVLSLWAFLNLLPSAWILVTTSFFEGDSPAIDQILDDEEVAALSSKERTSINSVAVYANGLNAAFCGMALFVIWFGLKRRAKWAFWGLAFGFSMAWLAGTLGDYVLGLVHPEINVISALILVLGLGLSAVDLFLRKERIGARP